jgi:two-component system nitrogen regulation response regulator GlnG
MVELESRAWHGNVRELRNVIESATVVCRGDFIQPEHLPQPVTSLNSDRIAAPDVRPANSSAALAEVAREWMLEQVRTADADVRDLYEKFLQTVEPELITIALQSTNGHRGSAARLLGMHRETLREKLKRMGEDQSTD